MPHRIDKLLLDLRLSCEELIQFVEPVSYDEFVDNRILLLAVEREYIIIVEALSRLERIDPNNIEAKIPDYHKIIGFRNLITHGYDIIDDYSLWDFAKNLVPILLNQIENY